MSSKPGDECTSCGIDCELRDKEGGISPEDLNRAPYECPRRLTLALPPTILEALQPPANALASYGTYISRVLDQASPVEIAFQSIEPILRNYDRLNLMLVAAAGTYYPAEILSSIPVELGKIRKKPKTSLIARMRDCPKGRKHWKKYQDICRLILIRLLVPPLQKPLEESRTREGIQRRDLLFPIPYDTNGYWGHVKDKYSTEFLIVDCKNYSSPIRGNTVDKVASYLGKQRLGNYALILSRYPPHSSATTRTENLWRDDEKMILPLCDEELEQMTRLKEQGKAPELILDNKVKALRASLS